MEQPQLDSDEWRLILTLLGGEAALAASASQHRAFQRPRGVKSAADLLRLAFMYGPGGQSLRRLAVAAGTDGVADVSDVALLNRIRKAADWLQALCVEQLAGVRAESVKAGASCKALGEKLGEKLGEGLAALPAASCAARRPVPVRVVDGSRLNGPGDHVWRLHLCYDPVGARLMDAKITTLAHGERLDRLAVQPGEIRLADRGFPQPDGLRATLEAGADVLVRLTWNSLRLTDAAGHPLDWMALFQSLDPTAAAARGGAPDRGALDMTVQVRKPRGTFAPIAMRLVIVVKPPEAAAHARKAARKASRKDGRARLDPRTLAAADHMILLTSLAAETFTVSGLVALYRVRWQIELAFKRLKSILHMDRLPAKDEGLARAWLHAHLLFALIVDRVHADPGAFPP